MSELKYNFSGIEGAVSGSFDDGNVDSFASTGDAGAAREANPFLKFKFETVFTTKIDWSGSGEHDTNDAFDFTAMEAGADGTETRSGLQQNIQQISTVQQDVDSTAGDLAGALSGPAGDAASDPLSYNFSGIEGAASAGFDDGNSFAITGDEGQTVQKLASIWGGSGSDAYQATQQRWDQQAADDCGSTLSSSMGFKTPPDDGFDFKAMESGEAASADTTDQDFALVIYNANRDACIGDACNGGNAGILFGDGGDGLNFDGKFLTAHDLIREQTSVFDAGFDLI